LITSHSKDYKQNFEKRHQDNRFSDYGIFAFDVTKTQKNYEIHIGALSVSLRLAFLLTREVYKNMI